MGYCICKKNMGFVSRNTIAVRCKSALKIFLQNKLLILLRRLWVSRSFRKLFQKSSEPLREALWSSFRSFNSDDTLRRPVCPTSEFPLRIIITKPVCQNIFHSALNSTYLANTRIHFPTALAYRASRAGTWLNFMEEWASKTYSKRQRPRWRCRWWWCSCWCSHQKSFQGKM